MKMVAIIDGDEHELCSEDCCSSGLNGPCRTCGGRIHYQATYGGFVELCEECDRGDFQPPASALKR